MSTTLIVGGVQAILRAAQAGADLYSEHARDHDVFLPNLELPAGSRSIQLHSFCMDNPQLASSVPQLAAIWDAVNKELNSTAPIDIDNAYTAMLKHKAKIQLIEEGRESGDADREADLLASGRMIEQWRKERKPPSPLIRMALTLTDIGLEYVSANPTILGVSTSGEKLIVSFATHMSSLIPDDVREFGPVTDFADRLVGIFLRAGLGTLSSNSSAVFKDEDIAKLLVGVAKPIVDALPNDIAQQIQYRDLVDVLAGPSAEAAFRLLAENTESYLGKDFANDKALGVVTSALFEEVQTTVENGTIVDVFGEQGLIRLYQAGLGVAVQQPGLFLADDSDAKKELFKDLISGTASILIAHPRLKGPIGASLGAMAVTAVGNNAAGLMRLAPDEPWEKITVTVIRQLTTGLSDALSNQKNPITLFSDEQLIQFGRVVLQQVAQTPGMLGAERSEVQSIVTGIAQTMVADDNLLLSAHQWIGLAGVMANRAASNPSRYFGLTIDDQGDALAVQVVSSVLKVAGETWSAAGRKKESLLFGETLEAIVESSVDALTGNVTAIVQNRNLVGEFLRMLVEDAAGNPSKYGSEGLLNLFGLSIGKVMASGTLPTGDEINQALAG